jgi:hypothetical protein
LLQYSCSTDDILPVVELSSNADSLSEDNGSVIITASLNGTFSEELNFNLSFTGSATLSEDYSASSNTISIAEGELSGSIQLNSIQDVIIEQPESIIISLDASQVLSDFSTSEIQISLLDDDIDTDEDGVFDNEDECPEIPGDPLNNGCPFLGFLINEVLYDPPSGSAGDANNDGTRDPNEDEFIEFFNSGPELDMSGWTVSDASQLRHVFPANTIVPVNGVLVLFGGGAPNGTFGGAIVQTASEGENINMNNSGDFVTVADADGNVVVTFDVEPLSNNPNESYTRFPDLTGGFVQHNDEIEEVDTLFSPGTKIDGSEF